jgi:hypothetical protein
MLGSYSTSSPSTLLGVCLSFGRDEIVSVGPVAVSPASQQLGLVSSSWRWINFHHQGSDPALRSLINQGRKLMSKSMDYWRENGKSLFILTQDAYNKASLPLYMALGFHVRITGSQLWLMDVKKLKIGKDEEGEKIKKKKELNAYSPLLPNS